MTTKQEMLSAIRSNLPSGEHPLPEVKVFPIHADEPALELFTRMLSLMGGHLLEVNGSIAAAIRAQFPDASNVVSASTQVPSDRDLRAVAHQADLDDVDVAVVRASCAVAETGSVMLTDDDITVNSLAYLAQHLVVLVDPADVVPGLQEAYLRPEFSKHRYVVFHSGPSATADIEGVLIRGAQGVRSLHVVLAPRP